MSITTLRNFFAAALLAAAAPLIAQTAPQPEISYTDDFQSYGAHANPAGWVDTSVGSSTPAAKGLYKTWPDPTAGSGTNIVYGTQQSSGKPAGNNPRIGTFSTYTAKSFPLKGRFEYRGRFLRTNADSHIGLTFCSAYPEKDQYYLAGLWPQASGTLTMQLFAFGGSGFAGTTDSGFTPEAGKWYRFLIQVDDVAGATAVRIRFWRDGTTEPATFSIDAKDSGATRLTGGRIGIWAAVRGDAFVDDLAAKSQVDTTPPAIAFADHATHAALDPAVTALFKVPAAIDVVINDTSPIASQTIRLDGATYVPGTTIATDSRHVLAVDAVDTAGNSAHATLNLVVDQVAPAIALSINNAPFTEGQLFGTDVVVAATVTDTSSVKTTALLDGSTVALPAPVAEEKAHAITVTSTDEVGWTTSVTRAFTIDKSAPTVSVFANGLPLGSGDAFPIDVTLTWTVADLTLDRVTATLDGTTIASGFRVTTGGVHELTIVAVDRLGHTTTVTRSFPLSKSAPEVHLLANGATFVAGTSFDRAVAFTATIADPTPTTYVATVDGADYRFGAPIANESATHTIALRVKNAAGLESAIGPHPFTIDLHAPQLTLTESGAPFTDGAKYTRDVVPVVTATDNFTTAPVRTLLVDGKDFPLDHAIASESADHTISATATDAAGNTATAGPFHFVLDKTKPIVTVTDGEAKPFAADALFAHAVTLRVVVTDVTATHVAAVATSPSGAVVTFGTGVAQSDGSVIFTSQPLTADATYALSIVATDAVGLTSDPIAVTFRIDTAPPAIAFATPAENAVVATPTLLVAGNSDDAVSVTVNGNDAQVNASAKTFAVSGVSLSEGRNELVAVAFDQAGNRGTAKRTVTLDSTAPSLEVAAPLPDACVRDTQLTIAGRAADANLSSVKATLVPGGTAVTATVANGAFTATLPLGVDGAYVLTVEAVDASGHTSSATLPLRVDRTAPRVDVRENGTALIAGAAFNRAVSPFIVVSDADPDIRVVATLDGQPYVSGSTIAAAGNHTLVVTAQDCAGNTAAPRSLSFAIDVTAPVFLSLTPQDNTVLGIPSATVRGTVQDADLASVTMQGSAIAATISGTAFTFDNVALAEGMNRFVLVAMDRAGNQTTRAYSLRVSTLAPSVEILDNGVAIGSGGVFNRPLAPTIIVSDAAATTVATLNGASFTSGTPIAQDGSYTLTATATDAVGHTGTATATFTIDRTAPVVTLATPLDGATVTTAQVDVRGSVTGAESVTVNGVPATRNADGSFVVTIPVDFGANVIVATARDAAGNSGEAHVTVTRTDNRPGIILTAPIDNLLTNRSTTAVIGQLLSPVAGAKVTINGSDVAVDALGAFRVNAFPLLEGDNTISVSVIGAPAKSVTVHVTADFTAPVVTVRANGVALAGGTRFATAPAIAVDAVDRGVVTTRATIDGISGTDTSALRDGGHVLAATARDAAGNETRVDRTFFIGAASASGSCTVALSSIDPPNGATILDDSVTLRGRSGGGNVLVNGTRAQVADGTFVASVQLVEGRNDVRIQCADSTGAAAGDAILLTLFRSSGAPSVRITSPANATSAAGDRITVTGEVGAGVVAGDVNGIPFAVANDGAATHAFSVANVALANGLNVVAARAKDGAGRPGIATIHVTRRSVAPALAITSPVAGTETGSATSDVTGTYANVDPASIAIAGAVVTTQPSSDTTGLFTAATVPLTTPKTTIVANARGTDGSTIAATVDVTRGSGPSITIDAPLDNRDYAASATKPDTIRGTIAATGGATVQVNGIQATVDGNQFSAAAEFNAAGGVTPIIARVTQLDGAIASDAIRVRKLQALAVTQSFPAAGATSVDRGAAIVLLFSNPLAGQSIAGALRLADANGMAITGATFVDDNAVTFAPDVPFAAGGRYTFMVSTAAHDLAGQSLASPFTLTFDTGAAAPLTAPVIDAHDESGCITSRTIHGTASTGGARIRADVDGVPVSTTAAADRSFTLTINLAGQTGYHVVRVRELGSDGTLSPERTVTYRVNCAGPQVTSTSLDRGARTLTIAFSTPMNAASLATAISLTPAGGTALNGSVVVDATGQTATVTYAADLANGTLTLLVTTAAHDASGVAMAADYSEQFAPGDPSSTSGGFVAGAVYDATNGRPLASAHVDVMPASLTLATDDRGRYSHALAEGAYTLRASAAGFATVWRQVVVPVGVGIVPIDIRLTKRAAEQLTTSSALTISDVAATSVTRDAVLTLSAATLTPGRKVSLTGIGGQSLAGLLPLGWSPIAAAEIAVDGSSLPEPLAGAKLTFGLTQSDAAAIAAASQTLSLVTYDADRDEWRVVAAAAAIGSDRRVTTDITASGIYALVYPDAAPSLAHPSAPHAGAALQGVANPCTAASDACTMRQTSFPLNPAAVLPNQRATATLTTDTIKPYPSGTAVQAFIDEELNLADGRVLFDPPFATDLLIYRTPSGDAGAAAFHIAPTSQASTVTLRDGVDHIRVVDYPGRIDRGALIGSEGGRIPGDDVVAIDVPAGATGEAIHASSRALSDAELHTIPSVAGFHVVAAFDLSLSRATDPSTSTYPAAPVELTKSARATFALTAAQLTGSGQVIVAESLPSTDYGALLRLAARTAASVAPDVAGTKRFTTLDVNSVELPLDGIVRNGRYVILTADAPIAFSWGRVQLGASGVPMMNARVTPGAGTPQTSALGVVDVTRLGGVFAVPVPASAFTLLPRHTSTGDGTAAAGPRIPQRDEIVAFGVLPLTAQAPLLVGITPSATDLDPSSPLQVQATFDTAIDAASAVNGIIVNNLTTGTAMSGRSQTLGSVVTFTPAAGESLVPASRYGISIAASIRGINGEPFGRVATATFTTAAVPSPSKGFNASAIRITIPDATGASTITGGAGAIPANAVAVAIRRGHAFLQQYQGVASTAGAFRFTVGSGDAYDHITIDDDIDLHVIDSVSHATVAIIPLTPFVTAEGDGFVAAPRVTSTFTTDAPGSVTITVPANAFDKNTIVRVQAMAPAAFARVPSIATELTVTAGITVSFDGVARVPLELDIPVPAGVSTAGRQFFLARLCSSTRGPRLEIDDTLRVDGDHFTTRAGVSGSSLRAMSANGHIRANDTETGVDLKSRLLRVASPASYSVVDMHVSGGSLGFAAMDGLENNVEIFFDRFNSLFASSFYLTASRGRIAVPVIVGQPFRVEGVEASTGLTVFSKEYAQAAPSPGGTAVTVESPVDNKSGPYPVAGDPFRLQLVDIPSLGDLEVTGFKLTLQKDANGATGSTPIFTVAAVGAAPSTMRVLNVTKHTISADGATATVAASVGDRLIILAANDLADPTDHLTVTFSKALGDATASALDAAVTLQQNYAPGTAAGNWLNVLGATSTLESGRRVRLQFASELRRGVQFRLRLAGTIADGGFPPHTLSESTKNDLYLYFTIRGPKGDILPADSPFTLSRGVIRDLAQDGNLLLVSALDGGLLAYDVSNPAALAAKLPLHATPIAWAPTQPVGGLTPGESWGVAVDRHGRVYSTALSDVNGLVRTYRTEQFAAGLSAASKPIAVQPYADAVVSWRPGINVGVSLGTSVSFQSDRPEATPRKIQLTSQDDEHTYIGGATFEALVGASGAGSFARATLLAKSYGETKAYDVAVDPDHDQLYRRQRITILNETLGLRWSKDARTGADFDGQPVTFANVLVRAGDTIRIVRNRRTYGVISMFGFGISLFDLNASESNHLTESPSSSGLLAEQLAATDGSRKTICVESLQPAGRPCPVPDLTLSPDAIVINEAEPTPRFHVFAIDARRGIGEVTIDATAVTESTGSGSTTTGNQATVGDGLPFTGSYSGSCPNGTCFHDHPRLASIREKFTAAKRPLLARFSTIATYAVSHACAAKASELCVTSYALVAANQFGILVIDLSTPLDQNSLADVIWLRSGATAVRVLSGTHYATAVDGRGRALLIDLSQLDQRNLVTPLGSCENAQCTAALFPTLEQSLASGADASDPLAFGSDDPRVRWMSDAAGSGGTLAPIGDVETGFLFNGELLQTKVGVLSATDPVVTIKANLGRGALVGVGSIIPMGITPSQAFLDEKAKLKPCVPDSVDAQLPTRCSDNASLGAFRVFVALPGSIGESSNTPPRLALESERIPGGIAPQTSTLLPVAHLRSDGADARNTPAFTLQHAVPEDANVPNARLQKGWNQFVTPWVVAIADPRAARDYDWGSALPDKNGCANCSYPLFLKKAKANTDVFELLTAGRNLVVRPSSAFAGPYQYLADGKRVFARVGTIIADTVRPPDVTVAAQNPPVAEGQLASSVYVHSGELESSSVDLDAGGRSGWNVIADRSYRSRTIGETAVGFGFDSTNFRRLRVLPNGDVEYRDGSGDVRLFTLGKDAYASPAGYYVTLAAERDGWTMRDQSGRVSRFDQYGRLVTESDEFKSFKTEGNTVTYSYDASDRLVRVTDPVGRATTLTYWAADESGNGAFTGRLHSVADWRGRTVDFAYDSAGRLLKVALPTAVAADNVPAEFNLVGDHRPKMEYEYVPQATTYNDRLELSTNISTVKDPGDASPRLTFSYDTSADIAKRDRLMNETWATHETATFTYTSPTMVESTDVLGQKRTYTLAKQADGQQHIVGIAVHDVAVLPSETLPAAAPLVAPTQTKDLNSTFAYDANGELTSATYANGLKAVNTFIPVPAYVASGVIDAPASGDASTSSNDGGIAGTVLSTSTISGTGIEKPIVTTIGYDTSQAMTRATMKSMTRGDIKRDAEVPSFGNLETATRDDNVSYHVVHDAAGRVVRRDQTTENAPKSVTADNTTAPPPTPPTLTTSISYFDDASKNLYERGAASMVTTGSSAEQTTMTYAAVGGGGTKIVATDAIRNVTTTSTFDSYGRPTSTITIDGGGTELANERFGYDEGGRLRYHQRRQAGLGDIETRNEYDAMGRPVKTSTAKAYVDDAPATVVAKTEWDLASRKVTHFDPVVGEDAPVAKQVSTLDPLGRVTRTERTTTDQKLTLTTAMAYDEAGNTVFESDGKRFAVQRRFDAAGRQTGVVSHDKTHATQTWNDWNEPIEAVSYDADNKVAGRSKSDYTRDGVLLGTNEQIGASSGTGRRTAIKWADGGAQMMSKIGSITSMDANGLPIEARATETKHDTAGRVTLTRSGETTGDFFDAEKATQSVFAATRTTFTGDVPTRVVNEEPLAKAEYSTSFEHDGVGRLTTTREANTYETASTYDEAGHVLSFRRPGLAAEQNTYDSRGLARSHQLADGKTVHYRYDERGNVRQFTDESGETTRYDTDDLGRVVKVRYADGSSEETTYESGSNTVMARRDRANQWFSYTYDDGGRVTILHAGPDPTSAPPLVLYAYDAAGRLRSVRNADAGIAYENFDLLGRAATTRAIRYTNGSGLDATPNVLSTHTQTHTWTVHGERATWTMPDGGAGENWLGTITQTFDAGGNLSSQKNGDTTLVSSMPRSLGRINERTRMTTQKIALTTAYGYADGKAQDQPLPEGSTPPQSGMALWSATTVDGVTLAGSSNARDNGKRLDTLRDLGLGGRRSLWQYDGRGRLTSTLLQTARKDAKPMTDELIDADFRSRRNATAELSKADHAIIGDMTSLMLEPPTWTAAQSATTHRVVSRGLLLDDELKQTLSYTYDPGARRTGDGVWTYTLDAFGRVTSATSTTVGRRIDYAWDPNNRLVARNAYRNDGSGTWIAEDRGDVLSADGLPASSTWVWDPIDDRLIAIYDKDGGLLRQYLHGDRGYDDPEEVRIAEAAGAAPKTYYPVLDESGTGSLQAVLGADGNFVERVLYADSYGDAPRYLQGPIVDRMMLEVKKGNEGQIVGAKVRVHLDEKIVESTLTGFQLMVVRADGSPVAAVGVAPTLEDDYTAIWTIAGDAWTALTTLPTATSLEISVTNTVRTKGWGPTPIAPIPTWALQLYGGTATTPTRPVIKREPLDQITAFIATIAPADTRTYGPMYEMKSLYLAANTTSKSKLLFDFHAYPFREPATGLVFVRARWYEPATGSWLSPDALSYKDSANLYAFAGEDPVNGRDATGQANTQTLTAGTPGQTASVSGVTFDSRADYISYLMANGVSLEQAMFAAETGGYPSDPLASNALPIFKRSAAMAAPAVNRMEGAFGLMGAVGQGYAAVETGNPSLGLLALNNAWAGGKLMITGNPEPTPLGSVIRNPWVESGVNAAAGFAPGFRGGSAPGNVAADTTEPVNQIGEVDTPPTRQLAGGAHKNLSTSGLQRHHMPADSVSPLSTGRGPAIEMIPEDHMLTASWGRSRVAIAYRARQAQLINEGRFVEAMQMDINDARVLFGTKYDGAIEQMLKYSSKIDPAKTNPAPPSIMRKP